VINPFWLDNREYLTTKKSETVQFNAQVDAFKANPEAIKSFESLVTTHPYLPIDVTYSAWGANIPAGSRDLFDIEDDEPQSRMFFL